MFRVLGIGLLVAAFSASVAAEDIDDVELGLEEAIAESEAARQNAEALGRQKVQEQQVFAERKQEAIEEQARAEETEKRAKAEIARLDKEIQRIKEQTRIQEKLIQAARAKIKKHEDHLSARQGDLRKSQADLNAVQEAHDIEKKRLDDLNAQILQVRNQTAENRRLIAEKKKQYLILKRQRMLKERELASVKEKERQQRLKAGR